MAKVLGESHGRLRYLTYALTMALHLPSGDAARGRAERLILDQIAAELAATGARPSTRTRKSTRP